MTGGAQRAETKGVRPWLLQARIRQTSPAYTGRPIVPAPETERHRSPMQRLSAMPVETIFRSISDRSCVSGSEVWQPTWRAANVRARSGQSPPDAVGSRKSLSTKSPGEGQELPESPNVKAMFSLRFSDLGKARNDKAECRFIATLLPLLIPAFSESSGCVDAICHSRG